MPTWAVLSAILGLLIGPTGAVWAIRDWKATRQGKEISQTAELIVMFRAYIAEMEKALARQKDELQEERERGNGEAARADRAEEALDACQAECRRMRLDLERWEQGGSAPAWKPPARD